MEYSKFLEVEDGVIVSYKGDSEIYYCGDYKADIIGNGAFRHCDSLKYLNIRRYVKEIRDYAFFNCSNLKSVVFDHDCALTYLKKAVFGNCKNLELVFLSSKIQTIEEDAFRYCENLKLIEIPKSVKYIHHNAFSGCKNLTIYCPDRTDCPNEWYKAAWLGDNPNEEPKVIYGKSILEDVENIQASKMFDDSEAFEIKDGELLAYKSANPIVNIPEGVTKISEKAFSLNSYIMRVTIPEGVSEIPKDGFRQCSNLSKVILNDGVKKIADSAFFSCDALTTINLPKSLVEIEKNAFYSSGLEKIFIPENVEKIGDGAFSICNDLKEITVSGNNKYFTVENHTLFSKDMKRLLIYVNNKDVALFIPESVVSIDKHAIRSMWNNLKYVYIPKTVKSLTVESITGSELKAFTDAKKWPKGWKKNYYTSSYELKPEKITWKSKTIPPELIPVTTPEGIIYSADYSVFIQYPYEILNKAKNINEFAIPSTVTKVKENAVIASNFKKFFIPKSVTVIEENAIRLFSTDAVIYCEAKKPPKSWHKNCFGTENNTKIIWGAKIH